MRKKLQILLTIVFIVMLASCNYIKVRDPGESVEITLKEYLTEGFFLRDEDYFRHLHSDEIVKTLKIEELISIKGTDLILVLYTYSVASQIKKKAQWFRSVNGKMTLVFQYFSTYSDDPLGNGDKEYALEIIKKAEKWEESTKAIWW
jgi:hypothetical protein